MADGRVDDTYLKLKAQLLAYRLRPGDRLNETALAQALDVSRTPLREALNRLVSEDLVVFQPGAGFFARGLDARAVFDLYELRLVLECAACALACARASDAALAALAADLEARGLDVAGLTVGEACARDEAFHLGIAKASGNAALEAQLRRVGEQIRYIRWVSLSMGALRHSKDEHRAIMAALVARDAARADAVMRAHVGKRMDEVTGFVRQGISALYMDPDADLSGEVLGVAPGDGRPVAVKEGQT
ncbi:GntR family transcriptional regulator [Cognatishimia sp. F0-27]|uniref:GntR family transcriptional regulator n=1 Tax=Cognatishimia sp. F0-27 TaxID=2816855 RepID=UPI001D0CB689|nr:GntR family transcriptional regulator [Cognatishimia sp. F0-27]MCC1494816.1 GntR family transcriptional regulator [Cognatishimia sp. F0-27]